MQNPHTPQRTGWVILVLMTGSNCLPWMEPLIRETLSFDLVAPARVIGTNTTACLQSGTIYGYVALVEGLVARIQDELGTLARVIGTGGLVDLIAGQTKTIEVVDRDLTLKGLRLLAELNDD